MPITLAQHEKKLQEPALCEQLAVRDYLDDVVVRTSGSFVAGYALKGLTSYFASDEGRNRGKLMMEALLRSIPEQSMRVQFRYEVLEDLEICSTGTWLVRGRRIRKRLRSMRRGSSSGGRKKRTAII